MSVASRGEGDEGDEGEGDETEASKATVRAALESFLWWEIPSFVPSSLGSVLSISFSFSFLSSSSTKISFIPIGPPLCVTLPSKTAINAPTGTRCPPSLPFGSSLASDRFRRINEVQIEPRWEESQRVMSGDDELIL